MADQEATTTTTTPTPTTTSSSNSNSDDPTAATATTTTNSNLPSSPFVTPSDILEQLNAHLPCNAKFELHKQLVAPNTSSSSNNTRHTRLATPSEARANDFQHKLQQAAAHLATLQNDDDKAQWLHDQQRLGHAYFAHQHYSDALDVYLCGTLAVVDNTSTTTTTNRREYVLGRLLYHCAQCTFQLQQYQKTIHFCTMAVDPLLLLQNNNKNESRLLLLLLAQLYLLRSQAGRLRGDYSKNDLQQCRALVLKVLDDTDNDNNKFTNKDDDDTTTTARGLANDLDTETQLLAAARQSAVALQNRQRAALQQLWSSSSSHTDNNNNNHASLLLLYSDHHATRTHSTIVAPPREDNIDNRSCLYWQQYYWEVIGRVAQTLVDWMEARKQRRQPPSDDHHHHKTD